MEMLFGTNVREYGQHVGRLAGFEVEPSTRRVRKIVYSGDGDLGSHALTRPFESVLVEPGHVEIHPYTSPDPSHSRDAVLLSHATRIMRAGRQIGRLTGIEVAIGTGELEAIVGRKNWWTRRFRCEAATLDFSVPGEVRTAAAPARAA